MMVQEAALAAADWIALTAQSVAAIASAAAAVFAWQTVRGIRDDRDRERRAQSTEHLKRIHRLIAQLVDAGSRDRPSVFRAHMELRSEVGIVTVPLPRCLALVNARTDDLLLDYGPDSQLHRLADPALAEVEAAMRLLWEGRLVEPGE